MVESIILRFNDIFGQSVVFDVTPYKEDLIIKQFDHAELYNGVRMTRTEFESYWRHANLSFDTSRI